MTTEAPGFSDAWEIFIRTSVGEVGRGRLYDKRRTESGWPEVECVRAFIVPDDEGSPSRPGCWCLPFCSTH